MNRGEIWCVNLAAPGSSEPGFRRPVIIVSSNAFNHSQINTVLAVAVSTNLNLSKAPGNVMIPQKQSGLPRDSVANVSQVITATKSFLTGCVGSVPPKLMQQIDNGLRLVMSL